MGENLRKVELELPSGANQAWSLHIRKLAPATSQAA